MALNTPINVTAASISASSLPSGISPAYQQYILSQAADFSAVAGKANEAGQGAYDAKAKNEEQDVVLANHDGRITANTNAITLLEVRITTAEGDIVTLQSDVDYLTSEVIRIEASISSIQGDYVSKSATAPQTLSSPFGINTSLSVDGVKVVGPRQTGWTAANGSAFLGAFNASQPYPAGATYTQSEIQTLAAGLVEARQRIKALEDMARTHGLIN